MTLSQIFSKLNVLNAEVALCRNNYRFSDDSERWGCSITLDHEGTEIKVRANAADGDEALINAFRKLDDLLSAGQVVRALNLPLLSSPVVDESTVPFSAS